MSVLHFDFKDFTSTSTDTAAVFLEVGAAPYFSQLSMAIYFKLVEIQNFNYEVPCSLFITQIS